MRSKTDVQRGITPVFLNYKVVGFKLWIAFLGVIMLMGAYTAYNVFTKGLAVTGLNNIVTWGLWIIGDTSFGALSSGAFMVAVAVYLFKKKEFKPLGRVSVIIGVIADSMALIVLLVDIGRPERFWHPLIFWNPSSFMWIIVIALIIYFNILLIEMLPVIADIPVIKKKIPILQRLAEFLHKLMPVFAVMALCAALTHQIALGGVFAVIRGRLLWYGSHTIALFVLSALIAGPALILFAMILTEKISGKTILKNNLVDLVVRCLSVMFPAYLFMRVIHLITLNWHGISERAEILNILLASGVFNVGEVTFGLVIPSLFFLIPAMRRDRWWIMIAMFSLLVGTFSFRWNMIVTELIIPPVSPDAVLLYGSYAPNWAEWTMLATALAFGLLVYTISARYLPIFGVEDNQDIKYVSMEEI